VTGKITGDVTIRFAEIDDDDQGLAQEFGRGPGPGPIGTYWFGLQIPQPPRRR